MRAFILAGGKGRRLLPLTETVPKPLLSFKGKMIIEHVFDILKKNGTNDVTLTLGHHAFEFKNRLGDGSEYGMKIQYFVENEPLGTAGFLKLVPRFSEPVLVMNADEISPIDLKKMCAAHIAHAARGAVATVAVTPSPVGNVVLDNSKEKILEFLWNNGSSRLPFSNVGYYVVGPSVFDYLPESKVIMFEKDIFPQLARSGKIFAHYVTAERKHFQDLETYKKFVEQG